MATLIANNFSSECYFFVSTQPQITHNTGVQITDPSMEATLMLFSFFLRSHVDLAGLELAIHSAVQGMHVGFTKPGLEATLK